MSITGYAVYIPQARVGTSRTNPNHAYGRDVHISSPVHRSNGSKPLIRKYLTELWWRKAKVGLHAVYIVRIVVLIITTRLTNAME